MRTLGIPEVSVHLKKGGKLMGKEWEKNQIKESFFVCCIFNCFSFQIRLYLFLFLSLFGFLSSCCRFVSSSSRSLDTLNPKAKTQDPRANIVIFIV